MRYRHTIRVIFEDGDYFFTTINGCMEDIRKYYVGKVFNFGNVKNDINASIDEMKRCVRVEFLSEAEK